MASSLLAPALISCTPRHADAPAPPPSPAALGSKAPASRIPALDLAAVAVGGLAPDSTREGIDEDHLYEEAEAARLHSPAGTERCSAASEHLRQGLHPAVRTIQAPHPTESLLFHGLVVDDARLAARPRSKHRGTLGAGCRKEVPSRGAATPTTMASEAGAEAR
jgi:hypothetical protein